MLPGLAASVVSRKVAANFPVVAATNTSTTGGSTASTHTVSLPASISAGDMLIILASIASDGVTITGPSGFTEFLSASQAGTRPGVTLKGWYKVATGSEGASTTFGTSAGRNSAHTSYRITGYQGAPEAATAVGQSASPNPPSLSPSWGGNRTLWLAALALRGNTATISSSPSGYTNLLQNASSGGTATNQVRAGSVQREVLAGTEDPGAFTLSAGTEDWVAATVAVRPA